MRYDLDPSVSVLEVHASSSVHPLHTSAPVSGTVELTIDDAGAVDPAAPVGGTVELALGGMRSGNRLVDREAERRLDVRRHPTVSGQLEGLEPAGAPGTYRGWGSLQFHGVRRPVEGTVAVEPRGPDLHLSGELVLDVTDFGVQPPSLLVVKVHPDVRVVLDALARAVP